MLGLNSVTSFRAPAYCTKGSASSSLRSPERARITPPLRGTRAQRDDGARPPGAASAHLEPGGGRHSNRHESFQGASVMPHGSHQPARQCALDAPYPRDARLRARGRTDNRARQSAPRLAGNFDPWTSRYSSYLWTASPGLIAQPRMTRRLCFPTWRSQSERSPASTPRCCRPPITRVGEGSSSGTSALSTKRREARLPQLDAAPCTDFLPRAIATHSAI